MSIVNSLTPDIKPLEHPNPLKEAILKYVYRALKTHNWNQMKTAKVLAISPKTIRNYVEKLRDHGVDVPTRHWRKQ